MSWCGGEGPGDLGVGGEEGGWWSDRSAIALQAGPMDELSLAPVPKGRRETGCTCQTWALTYCSTFSLVPPA